jgi:hypothetical protein
MSTTFRVSTSTVTFDVTSLAEAEREVSKRGIVDADIFRRCECGCGAWAGKPFRLIRNGKTGDAS